MATSLEAKLQTALQATPAVTSLLSTRPDGKASIFEMQEYQGTAFPALVYFLVSAPNVYATLYRMQTVTSRVQFTIWDTDPERARQVEAALIAFLDTFNAVSPCTNFIGTVPQPVQVVNRRQGGNAQTQPLTYWRTLDAMILNNETF